MQHPSPDQPIVYNPYPNYESSEYLSKWEPVKQCFLDEAETVTIPDIYAYPGVPQHMPMPSFGSFDEIGVRQDVCFDRFGRFGAYGYGYKEKEGGSGIDTSVFRDRQGVERSMAR